MPELPEVETARRTLDPLVRGRRIERLEVRKPEALRSHRPAQAARILQGREIIALDRRGKALLFHLTGGWVLTFQFALWGVVLARDDGAADSATAILLHLGGGRIVEFRELQLSGLNLYPEAKLASVPFFASLGVDPLDRSITPARFRETLRGRGAIRNLLTDQARVAGIGNLWALEILYAAGLRPSHDARTITEGEWARLYRVTRSVLRRAIRAGGEPEFPDATGRKGRYRLAVYGREGKPCRRCGTTIAGGRVGGRPVAYCPKDQT
jgi:formamidopyrimidine-DNA glycosylase